MGRRDTSIWKTRTIRPVWPTRLLCCGRRDGRRLARYPLAVRRVPPRALLAADQAASREWGDAFIRTYLERDLPQLGINLPAITLRRFWTMLAHYHGQTWNGSELVGTPTLASER